MTADARSRAKLNGKRAGIVLLTTVAVVFIGLCALSIVPAVFGRGPDPLTPSPTGRACADAIVRLQGAVDRAARTAGGAPDEATAVSSFRGALAPDWDEEKRIEAVCGADPNGAGAFAALQRLRVAEETSARRRAVEIAPLRHDVRQYLPPAAPSPRTIDTP
jgi:hypothetical protein